MTLKEMIENNRYNTKKLLIFVLLSMINLIL